MGRSKNETKKQFLTKFEQQHGSDECYTHPAIYDVVSDFVTSRYHISPSLFVRPFWPGKDYTAYNYDPQQVVVDNPPFSKITPIVRYYLEHGVKFFLFAPSLTVFHIAFEHFSDFTHVIAGIDITYENGAKIPTSFVTNLSPGVAVETTPKLARDLKQADHDLGYGKPKHKVPRYSYPRNVVRVTDLVRSMKSGAVVTIPSDKLRRVATLDEQRQYKKQLYGGGILVADEIADEIEENKHRAEENKRRAGEVMEWHLSDREKEIIKELNKNK